MNLFRSHILRVYGFLLLLVGIAFNLADTSEQKVNHAAFTSWLGTHLKNDNSEAHQKLSDLSKNQSGLEETIRKASELVSTHADDFEFPVGTEDESPEQVFHLLLKQWNHFQNSEAGMGKAVLVESVKPTTILPNDGKIVASSLSKTQISGSKTSSEFISNPETTLSSSYLLSPLKSGTAIGAP